MKEGYTMKVNDRIHGFAVTRIAPAPCSGSELIEMRHEKTGAQLIWLKNDGENKLFSIAFRADEGDNEHLSQRNDLSR